VPFGYSATAVDVWSPTSIGWAFGDGTIASGDAGSKAYAAQGNYTATATATDAVGNSTQETRAIAVAGGEPPPAGGLLDKTPPVFLSASVKPKTFAVDPNGAAEQLVAASAKGTTFSYALSEPARVVFSVDRTIQGRKVGRKCRKQTPTNRKGKRCRLRTTVGRFAKPSTTGPNKKKFSGRMGKRRLKPAAYRVLLIATDAAGNKSPAKVLTIRVKRR
jgi:hypothetical protein